MIRRPDTQDLDAVSSLWLDANLEAHGFIPASYWLGHLEEVRAACRYNKTLAAKQLGVSRSTLWRKLKQYGLT